MCGIAYHSLDTSKTKVVSHITFSLHFRYFKEDIFLPLFPSLPKLNAAWRSTQHIFHKHILLFPYNYTYRRIASFIIDSSSKCFLSIVISTIFLVCIAARLKQFTPRRVYCFISIFHALLCTSNNKQSKGIKYKLYWYTKEQSKVSTKSGITTTAYY